MSHHHETQLSVRSTREQTLRAEKRVVDILLARNGGGLKGVHDLVLPMVAEAQKVAALDSEQADAAGRIGLLETHTNLAVPVEQREVAVRKIVDLFQEL